MAISLFYLLPYPWCNWFCPPALGALAYAVDLAKDPKPMDRQLVTLCLSDYVHTGCTQDKAFIASSAADFGAN